MRYPLPRTRIPKAIRHAALCCALALGGIANAQAFEPPLPGVPDPYSQGIDGTTSQKPRTIFAATIAALIAQSLGSGIGSALSDGIGGSITRWFTRDPGAVGAEPAFANRMTGDLEEPAVPHAGIAFEVHLIGRDGATRAVDPARHVFRTGDRFKLYYRPTLPGRVEVVNVNPQGSQSRVDAVEVAAGQLAALGPYQFVDAKGEETLRLLLEPCSSPLLTAATRSIVKVGAPAAEPAVRVGDCRDAATRGLRAKPRTITKTTMAGTTAFALDPLSERELSSGLPRAREVRISLQHR